MKTNLIVLARTKDIEDYEFYKLLLDPTTFLHQKAVVLIFATIQQFDDFLKSMPADYQFSLLVHMGLTNNRLGVDGDKLTDDLSKLPYFNKLKFEYTSRQGESVHNEKEVKYTPKITIKTFNTETIESNRVGDLLMPQSDAPNDGSSSKTEFAILTALDEHENDVIRAYMDENSIEELDGQTYRGKFIKLKNSDDYEGTFVLAAQRQMGMVDAAFSASALIHNYNPDFLIMGGVCGGRKSKVKLFDIIIPSKVYDFSYGSLENGTFMQRDLDAKINPAIINFLKKTENKKRILDRMVQLISTKENMWTQYVKDVDIHFDVMACGPWVVKTEDFLEHLSQDKNNLIRGLEMESYSIGRAYEIFEETTKTLVVKSVMDYTDEKKDDSFKDVPVKKIAGYISCLCVRAMLPLLLEFKEKKKTNK